MTPDRMLLILNRLSGLLFIDGEDVERLEVE